MSDDIKKIVEEGLSAVSAELKKATDEHTAEFEKHGKVSTELTGRIDELSGHFKSLQDEITELAQKSETMKKGAQKAVSAGDEFTASEGYKALVEGRVERTRIEVKNTIVNSSGTTFPAQREGVIPGNFLPLTVRSQIPTINVATNAVNSLKENSNTNNAEEVSEGGAKKESVITFAPYNVQIETVAHWLKVSNQLLADAPAVAAYIDLRLRDGLAQRIEKQLINGNGSTPNLSGLADSDNFVGFTPNSGANLVESINKAKYALWATGNVPDTVIVNPVDWAAMEIEREGSGTGMYLYGAPGTSASMSPFGCNVVLSQYMTAGKFLIGNLRSSAAIYQRQGAVVEMGFVGSDFTNNLVTIRAEERLGLGVDRPAGLMYGDITAS